MRPMKTSSTGCSRGSYGTIALIPRSRSRVVSRGGHGSKRVSFPTNRLADKAENSAGLFLSFCRCAHRDGTPRAFRLSPLAYQNESCRGTLVFGVSLSAFSFRRASPLSLINGVARGENIELKPVLFGPSSANFIAGSPRG